jgi:tRNA/rRNA methyltransferase
MGQMITIILMEPEHPGNIGAAARVIANFGLTKLALVSPQVDHLCPESIARSKHAKNVLTKAKIIKKKDLKKFDTLIATSAKLGSAYNQPRSPLTPEMLNEKLKEVKGNIGILFGREGIGLTNEEIKDCNFILTIPAHKKYPTLNLSHAITIVCYELFKLKGQEELENKFKPISRKEKEVINKKFSQIFDTLPFTTEQKKETQQMFWKKIISKSFLTQKEGYIILGFLKKLDEKLNLR